MNLQQNCPPLLTGVITLPCEMQHMTTLTSCSNHGDVSLSHHKLSLSPLSSHSMGSPEVELPYTTLFLTVLFQNFQADISSLRE